MIYGAARKLRYHGHDEYRDFRRVCRDFWPFALFTLSHLIRPYDYFTITSLIIFNFSDLLVMYLSFSFLRYPLTTHHDEALALTNYAFSFLLHQVYIFCHYSLQNFGVGNFVFPTDFHNTFLHVHISKIPHDSFSV